MNTHRNASNTARLADAIDRAADIILSEATRTAEDLGFTWSPSEGAPNTFPELQAAWERSVTTGEPLPVSSLNLDDCFYPSNVTYALRFYHDSWHMRTGYTFDMYDEVKLAALHMDWLGDHVVDPSKLEYQILHADFMGQALCMTVTRTFVSNQSVFILDCIEYGTDQAIVRELNRLGISKVEDAA
ncbi:hypothetical protein [Rhodococcus qingshengii]|uniref:hypothetical protein n=1 Tax=Rhodococcus qingshengii TaxID=334542 RepID=UPI00294241E3|nr:hypothetical protein [Rhodococcus qingshengii]WOI86007.1 hypothetical protein R0122_22775 [Rhodococcus qingshengii]